MDWIDISLHNGTCYCTIDKNLVNVEEHSGLDLALETIKKIVKDYPEPYILLCSGGADSQAMAYAWKQSKVNHEIFLFQYVDDNDIVYNTHDLKTFYEFAEKNNIKYSIKLLNYFDFLQNDFNKFAEKYNCASPQITVFMKMIQSFSKGTVIMSGNVITSMSFSAFSFDILGLYRFNKDYKNLIPFFFLHNPKLAFGFKKIDTAPTDRYEKKCTLYLTNGFPIIPQNGKFSGFEKIKDFFDNQKNLITSRDRLRFLNKPSQRIFDIKYRYMIEEQLGQRPNCITVYK